MLRMSAVVVLASIAAGCVTGEKISHIQPGMTKAEVTQVLGQPSGYQSAGDYEALHYANRYVSGWSNDKTDYFVVLENGRVVQYGNGEIRPGPQPNTLFLWTL